MSADFAIRVRDVSKEYRLGVIGHGTLYRDLQSWWARLRGHDDPNTKVGHLPGELASRPAASDGLFRALDGISFDLPPGEVLGVIGRNGAGKSTLLKIISRITTPTTGSIRFRGRVASLLEVGTGFHPELTGRENVFLNGAILGMRRHEIARKFDEIVAFSDIGEEFIDTPVKRYSSGMYVRLAFAVAAHLEPEILVVDEVLAVGDHRFQRKCMDKMSEVSTRGRTILFVSHNMAAIRKLCSRVLWLKAGRVVADGLPDEVVARYLEEGLTKAAAVTYYEDPTKDIQVRAVTLKDHAGRQSVYLDMLRPFRIEVEYQVHRRVSGVALSCALQTQFEETLLATADHDLDKGRLGTRERGVHTTSVEIPGNLINSGSFTLVVGISVPGKHIYDRREALVFDLFDSGSFVVDGGGEERRNSLLLLGLKWS
jgi:lipopolysaccharide transport system ATP-binding protein